LAVAKGAPGLRLCRRICGVDRVRINRIWVSRVSWISRIFGRIAVRIRRNRCGKLIARRVNLGRKSPNRLGITSRVTELVGKAVDKLGCGSDDGRIARYSLGKLVDSLLHSFDLPDQVGQLIAAYVDVDGLRRLAHWLSPLQNSNERLKGSE
jgi:hypothetical protein